jgi:hypothetical protein
VTDIFDDGEPPVLTLESLAAVVDRHRGALAPGPMASSWKDLWHFSSPFPIIVTDYLPAEQPRKLTRWERFRVWVEDLADRADVYYHYPRVRRTEPAKGYLIGRDLYTPRAAISVLGPFAS